MFNNISGMPIPESSSYEVSSNNMCDRDGIFLSVDTNSQCTHTCLIINNQKHPITCRLATSCSNRTWEVQGHRFFHVSPFSLFLWCLISNCEYKIFQLAPWMPCSVSRLENIYIQLEIGIFPSSCKYLSLSCVPCAQVVHDHL